MKSKMYVYIQIEFSDRDYATRNVFTVTAGKSERTKMMRVIPPPGCI